MTTYAEAIAFYEQAKERELRRFAAIPVPQ